MKINIIVAIDSKNGFAKDNNIPWHYTEDFKYFRKVTTDHICVMGRNTYLDMNNRIGHKNTTAILPNRISFVLSTTLGDLPNAQHVQSIDEFNYVLNNVAELQDREVFFIGGRQIFDIGVKLADKIYVTHINKDYGCDSFFDLDFVKSNFPHCIEVPGLDPDLTFKIYSKQKDVS